MKIKHLVIASQEYQSALESIGDQVNDDHEAQEELVLWSAIDEVAEAVTKEVKNQGVSPTLDQLHEEIKRRYKQ